MTFTRATLRELRPTLRLAAPITAGQVGQMLMGVADTIMIGHVGTIALAACAFANNILIVLAVTGYGVLTAVSIRVSHAHGAGVVPAMARALHAGMGLSVIMGLSGAALLHFVYPAFHFLGQAPGVVEEAQGYMLIVGWSLIPAWLTSSARNYLDAQSRPWPAFWIMFGGVWLNVLLNWILIYGNLGAPAMGLTGAGWATLVSRVVTVVGLVWFVWAGWSRPSERCGFDLAWWKDQWSLFRLGLPTGLQLLSEVGRLPWRVYSSAASGRCRWPRIRLPLPVHRPHSCFRSEWPWPRPCASPRSWVRGGRTSCVRLPQGRG